MAKKQIDELKADKRSLRGTLSNLSGKFPTALDHVLNTSCSPSFIAKVKLWRGKKRFSLSAYFDGVLDESALNIIDVRERIIFQRDDGKHIEIDVQAKSSDERVVLVEVKKTQKKIGIRAVEEFQEKIEAYQNLFPDQTVLPAFLSLGGFTDEANEYCKKQGIATAKKIKW